MKAQVTLELLFALTGYVLMVLVVLQAQNHFKSDLKNSLAGVKIHREIQYTADKCSYKYLNGKSVKIKENFTFPTETQGNKLIREESEGKAVSTTLSPHVTASQEGLICTSINPWYLEKDR